MLKRFKRLRPEYDLSDVLTPKRVRAIRRIGRHPAFAIPLLTVSLIGLLTVVIFLLVTGAGTNLADTETHVVIVNHDKIEQTVPSRATTVGELLERANIPLHEGDVVEPDITTEIVSDNFRVNVYRAVPVTIVDGNKKTFAYSAASTPRSIVKQVGIEVYPEDNLVLLPADNFLIEGSIGQRVVIQRSTPVNVNLYGTPVSIRTRAKTVSELFTERDIAQAKGDSVQPSLDTPITPNLQIFLLRPGQKIVTEEQDIAMPTQTVEDESLSFGVIVTRQQGSPGKKLVTYQIETVNGQEVGRKQIQELVTVPTVPEIIARGKAVQIPSDKQAVMAQAGIAASDYPYVDFIMSHESGWCPTKLQGQVGYCPPYAPETLPSNLGYGLGQATPGTKMAGFGDDWKTSAVTQLKWAIAYTKGRYGTWQAAYNYWQSHHNW